ncbi:MAG TPA: hypothetical protein VFE61_16720 [Candidatus Sulfotelmatobacter sp.]|nr:hypothetical protein [Candidatus Sulfotelmatobacter sp.]
MASPRTAKVRAGTLTIFAKAADQAVGWYANVSINLLCGELPALSEVGGMGISTLTTEQGGYSLCRTRVSPVRAEC